MKEELKIGLLSAQIEIQQYKLTVLQEEIDDNISQLLSSIKMLLGTTGRNVYPISDIVKTAQGTLIMAIQELHSLCNSLGDYGLDDFNLIESLKTEVERLNFRKKAHVTFAVSTTSLPLLRQTQLILFVVLIAMLKNSIEHSKEKAILVDICKEQIRVTIKDDETSPHTQQLSRKNKKKVEYYIKLIEGAIVWPLGAKEDREIKILIPVNDHSL